MGFLEIFANVISFIGNFMFSVTAFFKNKRLIILFQSTNHFLCIIAEFILKAYSGMVIEAVSLTRNILLIFVKTKNKVANVLIYTIFLAIAITVGVILNIKLSGNVWYGYLPIIGTSIYSVGLIIAFIIDLKPLDQELIIKSTLFVNCTLWGIYGVFVNMWSALICNIINVTLLTIAITKIIIAKEKEKKEEKAEKKKLEVSMSHN